MVRGFLSKTPFRVAVVSPHMVPSYGPLIWSSHKVPHMVLSNNPLIWSSHMVPSDGPLIWSPHVVPSYGPLIWSRAVTDNRFKSIRIDSSSQPINRFKTPESIHWNYPLFLPLQWHCCQKMPTILFLSNITNNILILLAVWCIMLYFYSLFIVILFNK